MQDVRELKGENGRLQQALRERPKVGPAGPGSVGSFDWESQKQRLLAKLESDFDEDDPRQSEDRLTVEGAIRITDQVVCEKEHLLSERDREIRELQQLLNDQASSIGNVAVGTSAIADILDQDDLIQEEQRELKFQQEQLQEKLRKAEIDISVERAKLARERAAGGREGPDT